jgi:hypothetical protein
MKEVDTKIYLSPAALRRAGGAGTYVRLLIGGWRGKKADYTLGFERYAGPVTEVTERHETVISEQLYNAFKEEAKRQFTEYALVIGLQEPEQDRENMQLLDMTNFEECYRGALERKAEIDKAWGKCHEAGKH